MTMKLKSGFGKAIQALAVLTTAIWTSPIYAQSTSVVTIPVNQETLVKYTDGTFRVDLLAELKKIQPATVNFEIQMIRFEAQTNVGGAQGLLRINNEYITGTPIETDPDLYGQSEPAAFQRFELKNNERAVIKSAFFVLNTGSQIRVRNLEVTLGPVQEVQIFGRYADSQVSAVGGGSVEVGDARPASTTLESIFANYYGFDEATQATLAQAQAEKEAASAAELAAQQAASMERLRQEEALREQLRYGIRLAQNGDLNSAQQTLSQGEGYLRQQSQNEMGGLGFLLKDEVIEYVAQLRQIVNQKEQAVRVQQQQIAQQQEALRRAEQQRIQSRPQPNFSAKVKCVKAKKAKVGNKKEFCIGEYVAGVWPDHNPPQIIDIDQRTKNLIVLFDYTNQPLNVSVESFPDHRR